MSSTFLHIGIVQFDIAWERPEENMRRIERLLLNSHDLDLIILPEMWSTGFTMRPEITAETFPGPALLWMTEQAEKRNSALAGSIALRDGRHFYNRWYCVFPDGHIVQYDKKHLFSFGGEDLQYTPGNEKILLEIKGWKIRPIICYDLRFPVWCRNTDDYDLLIVVANWPTPRIHHWDALLKARAIENQCYVAAVNRIGTDGNNLPYCGHSSIYDMNGQDVVLFGEDEGFQTLTLDKSLLNTFRDKFRFLQDRDHFTW